MLHSLPKANSWKLLLTLFCLSLIFSCRKDTAGLNEPPIIHPDFVTKVTAGNVSGFVTNENNDPVQGATVKIGGNTIITDEYGFFEANNVLVVKQAATVTVTQAGYFNGIKTFMAEEGKDAFFRIKLLPKTIAGTIDAAAGGQINTTSGVKISFPTLAIVNAATNAAYTGNVHVSATWLDPTSPELNSIMPGDLRGIDANNGMKLLTTYGMVAVEMRGNSGELLQIAPGKKAGLTFPIPSSILSSAPASIPLWSFDEERGLWKEEGSAVKTGNTYVGEVGHFSFWNCDIPNIWVQFNCTIHNPNGTPLSNVLVRISYLNNPGNSRYGITDGSGYVAGVVPGNEQLKLEVIGHSGNNEVILHSLNFITPNSNGSIFSLGVITLGSSTNNHLSIINGLVTDCSNNPVTNGYVYIINNGTGFSRSNLSNTGTYSAYCIISPGNSSISIFAEDISQNQQNSAPLNVSLNPGINTAPNIQACGFNTTEYVNISINGDTTNYKLPDFLWQFNYDWQPGNIPAYEIRTYRGNPLSNTNFYFKRDNIAVGSSQQLLGIQSEVPFNGQFSPTFVNITEFGPINQFIGGYFSGIFTGIPPSTAVYNVNVSFRLRRRY